MMANCQLNSIYEFSSVVNVETWNIRVHEYEINRKTHNEADYQIPGPQLCPVASSREVSRYAQRKRNVLNACAQVTPFRLGVKV